MPTKYDVFAKIITHSPISIRKLSFDKPIYHHISELEKDSLIIKKDNLLIPLKNRQSEIIFKIIKWSIKNNINYNFWFKKNMIKILKKLSNQNNKLLSKSISGNSKNLEIINFLIKNQFILIYKKTPKLGTLLDHSVLRNVIMLNSEKFKIREKYLGYKRIPEMILKTKKNILNPFGIKVFEFLAGSAQLEGSTLSISETVELLTKNIYPDKPVEDIQMIKNLNIALNYCINNLTKKLDIEKIKKINELCLFSLHKGAGILKKNKNKIQGNSNFKTATPNETPLRLEKFCKIFNSIKSREEVISKLGYIHNEFQHIHPFPDGNSRTTRLIVNWLLIKFDFPMLILKKGAFERYMNLTKLSKKRDDNKLRDFLLHVIYHENLLKN